MNTINNLFQAALWILFLAACVEHIAELMFVFGLVAIGIAAYVKWSRLDAQNRSKYDSTYPPPADDVVTLPEIADEPSRTRRIVPERKEDRRAS